MTPPRLPHAVLDMDSRRHKALKIERLLDLRPGERPVRMLEIGCGSGGISHYFATHPSIRCDVQAVDVHDNRLATDGYRFALVDGVALPFADGSFDVVISNHVVEHVGMPEAQRGHLRELHRVMAPDGIGYLAVPNRWMLVEPHFHLPFLSWIPRAWRDPYVRLMKKGERYDCELLTLPGIEGLFEEANLQARNIGVEALRATLSIEGTRGVVRKLVARVPDGVWRALSPWIPTLIYRFNAR